MLSGTGVVIKAELEGYELSKNIKIRLKTLRVPIRMDRVK